jgi:hypothetical protein
MWSSTKNCSLRSVLTQYTDRKNHRILEGFQMKASKNGTGEKQ